MLAFLNLYWWSICDIKRHFYIKCIYKHAWNHQNISFIIAIVIVITVFICSCFLLLFSCSSTQPQMWNKTPVQFYVDGVSWNSSHLFIIVICVIVLWSDYDKAGVLAKEYASTKGPGTTAKPQDHLFFRKLSPVVQRTLDKCVRENGFM